MSLMPRDTRTMEEKMQQFTSAVESMTTFGYTKPKLEVRQVFSKAHAFDTVKWVKKDAVIVGSDGKEKFRQNDVEVPEWWSDTTINIVVEKYFRINNGVRETSAKQMFGRVAGWLREQAVKQGVLDLEQAAVFEGELLYMFVHGMHAFNSPVWFNVGVSDSPQCSACFINSVDDTMESIIDLTKKEILLFKGGSGTGSNISSLRSSYESLSAGGKASGPVSFMKLFDSGAGVTKSGGKTRRAAKMVVMNVDHPDILEQANGEAGFISCKSKAEQVAHDLYSTGKYTAEWNKPGNIYDLVGYQNANNSVRVTDEFMRTVEKDGAWSTFKVKPDPMSVSGLPREIVHTYKAQEIWNKIAEAAWFCGDPGIQFDTSTNDWHTCPQSGRINASNPCQPAWATVLTPDGIRTFADIKVGSTIWSGTKWTKVIRKVATGIKSVYLYYTRAGIFAGTKEHKVISNGTRVEACLAETIDTAIGPRLFETSALSEEYASIIVDGLVFGDGYVKVSNLGKDHYPLLCIGQNDQSYFEDPIVSRFVSKEPFDKLVYRVVTSLNHHELPKTYLRVIPERYVHGTSVVIRSFLRGLYSANGSVVDNRITLKATSFTVVSQVQEMLSSIGIRSYYTTNKATEIEFSDGTYTSKESYDLNITTSRYDFATLIGFIQPYKQEKLAKVLATKSTRVKNNYDVVASKFVGEEPVWDIEVESEEHTYWTGGLLVSNCSEYLFLDDTACNLSSLNLLKFVDGKKFKLDEFIQACEIAIIAKELIVDASSYPSPVIADMSHRFRTLGLGYTNLGALLTYWGLPYDSMEGRNVASAITAVMTAAAYKKSSDLARVLGPFSEYDKNKESMLGVIQKHWDAAKRLPSTMIKEWQPLFESAYQLWRSAWEAGKLYGFRNAQVTVIAPTGTISFLMGAETTGIEPMLGCVVYKKIVGEGLLVLPNGVIKPALENLGYSDQQVSAILAYIQTKNVIHGAPGLDPKHESIFAEALGDHAIKPEGHVDMMAAVQPFISGGISKTVNMPKTATVRDIADIYMRSWKKGLKCVAVYRDGCKLSQPISTEFNEKSKSEKGLVFGSRRRLPQTRPSVTHKFTIGQQEGYLTVGLYDDGSIGEIFVNTSKQGSPLRGFVDAWAQAVSIGFQHGVPFEVLEEKYKDMMFEPNGLTDCAEVRIAKSVPDYVFRWMDIFIQKNGNQVTTPTSVSEKIVSSSFDGPPCTKCGNFTKRAGSCFCCQSCGSTTGCS